MRTLIHAGPVVECERCGASIRQATYEGGEPRWNDVSTTTGGDLPGGHEIRCTPPDGR